MGFSTLNIDLVGRKNGTFFFSTFFICQLPRQTLSQLYGLDIRPTTFQNYIKFSTTIIVKCNVRPRFLAGMVAD